MEKHFFIKSPLGLIGLLVGLLGLGLLLLAIFWKEPLNPNIYYMSDNTLQKIRITTTVSQESIAIPQADLFLTTPTKQADFKHTPTPEWMNYDGIDFRNKDVEVLFTMLCNQDTVYFKPFRVVPYTPEIMQSGEFSNDLDFSVAWEHLGYYGLWIHSGLSYNIGELTAYPLQINIEQDARGFLRTPSEVNQYFEDCMINAEMRTHQDDSVSINKVVAAVRVPSSEVNEVSRHAMDLVPYLAETYPDSGFDKMSPPGLLFYFCGQQLKGEIANPNYNKWTQARFIIGVMPLTDD